MPCEFGVNIPKALRDLNKAKIFNIENQVSENYLKNIKEENRASKCVSCNACIEKCPQKINILKYLKKAAKVLERV